MTNANRRNGPGRPPSIANPQARICHAAARLFAANGYDTTSLQDVARDVGMTKAGLYHYFPTKQALFDAIVLATLQDLIAQAETVLRDPGDARQKLVRYMTAHATWFEANRDRYRASFFGRAGGGMTDYTEEQLRLRRAYVSLLEALLRQGHEAGEIEVEDVAVLARGILGMLNWMARWYRPDGPRTACQIAQGYAGILLSGISRR